MKQVSKPWGSETWFAQTDKYVGKVLFIKKGHRLSLQYHEVKDETLYLLSGLVEIPIKDAASSRPPKVVKLTVGESIHIPPLTVHRITALEDSTFIEVSTPEVEDVVRLEDDYGRAN